MSFEQRQLSKPEALAWELYAATGIATMAGGLVASFYNEATTEQMSIPGLAAAAIGCALLHHASDANEYRVPDDGQVS